MTYSSPSRAAVVRMPATSEPAPGSVIPRQPIRSPAIEGAQVALLLLLVAEQVDRRGDHVRVDGHPHVEAAAPRVAQRLGADQGVEVVAALPSVLLRVAEPEEAQVTGALQDRVRPVVLLPLEAVGEDLLLHPRLHRLAQLLVLVGEDEVLARSAVVGLDDGLGSSGHCVSLGRSLAWAEGPGGKVDSNTSYFPQAVYDRGDGGAAPPTPKGDEPRKPPTHRYPACPRVRGRRASTRT